MAKKVVKKAPPKKRAAKKKQVKRKYPVAKVDYNEDHGSVSISLTTMYSPASYYRDYPYTEFDSVKQMDDFIELLCTARNHLQGKKLGEQENVYAEGSFCIDSKQKITDEYEHKDM